MKTALYAGTFDPCTNGHLDIIQRAILLFDKLTIVVAISPTKTPILTQERRVELLKEIFKHEAKIEVVSWGGLIVEYARANKIGHIVRGLRPTGDFENEFQMAAMNRKLNDKLDTVFLTTSDKLYYVSSSLVKEVWQHGGDISPFVPPLILNEMKKHRP